MRGALAPAAALFMTGALALAACRASGGGEVPQTPAEAAPVATGAPATTGAPSAAAGPAAQQVVTFHLAPTETGRRRELVPGLALSRVDPSGTSAAVPIARPPGDAGVGGDMSVVVPGPGHYKAHFLVARCAVDSTAARGGCRHDAPKPDEVEFDVPASGDVDVTVP